jgi:hypothetical protein
MANEARRMPRRSVRGTVDVIDTLTGERIGHIGNLSVSGMLLIAGVPMIDDGLYQLRFALPGHSDPIEVGAQVLWQDGGAAPGQSWVGMRFLGLAPAVTRRLHEWTQSDETDAH